MKLIIRLLLIFATLTGIYAASDASLIAEAHIRMNGHSGEYSILRENVISRNGADILHLFELMPQGFIAISGSDNIRPVLGYSYDNNIDLIPENPGYDYLVQLAMVHYQLLCNDDEQYESIREKNRVMWASYISHDESLRRSLLDGDEFGPWLLTYWHQAYPYNLYCPEDPETGRKSMTGCVATATAMIMNYWDFPYSIELTDEDSYYSDYTDPHIYIDAPSATLDTMIYTGPRGFEPSAEMKGKLNYAVGVMLDMNYSSSGSGTNNYASRFIDDFGFSNAYEVDRLFEEDGPIDNMINGRPMYVSLIGETYGHAVVADGWRETGEFHVKMGWGGSGDGWYAILDDELPSDFIMLNKLILDIYAQQHDDFPDTRETAKEITITDSLGKVINGIILGDDEDWLKFHANPDSTYQFYTTGPLDTYGEIYDSLGESYLLRADTGEVYGNFWLSFRPEYGQDGYYYIRIGDPSSLSLVNYKLFFRRILDDGPFIRLHIPEGGEILEPSDTFTVTFSLYSIPYGTPVRLELSTDGRFGPWETVSESISGFTFRWTPPVFDEDKDNCYLRVSIDDHGFVKDINDAPFTIKARDAIREEILPQRLSFHAYPNPFNSAVNINIGMASKVTIIDKVGRMVASFTNADQSIRWTPDKSLESGIYSVIGDDDFLGRIVFVK